MTAPTRIDDDLFAAAKAAGATQDRSAAQQINHWARLGAAIEDSRVAHRDLVAVLAGEKSYDDVDDFTQAAVRVAWEGQIEQRIAALDLEAVFRAEGRDSWVSADEDGTPLLVRADEEA